MLLLIVEIGRSHSILKISLHILRSTDHQYNNFKIGSTIFFALPNKNHTPKHLNFPPHFPPFTFLAMRSRA